VPDVIVIGAGVLGAATAYALTEAGAQVTVLDGGQVAGGTSAVTFAVDITRVKTPRTLFDLSVASAREHASLQRRWIRSRWLHEAASLEWELTERDRQRIQDRVGRLRNWGYPAQWMSAQGVRDIEPALTLPTSDTAAVAYYPDGAWYEPPVLARALLERAQQRSASVHVNDPVTAMATRHGRVTAVTTAAGRRLSADVVVNCAGPQAADVAALGGAELPLQQVPGLVATTTPAPTGLRTILAAADLNVRPHRGDRVVLHSWMLDRELGERPGPCRRLALAQRLLHRAQALLPALAPAAVQSALVGVRPVPLDGLPVAGFLPGLDNFYVVVSHSAVHLAPVLGRLAASEITGARQERLDPFRPTRFCPGDQERDVLDDSARTMLACINPLSAEEPSNVV
jgi:glycine/D-amino acid oxidase-like deaminating enzyme